MHSKTKQSNKFSSFYFSALIALNKMDFFCHKHLNLSFLILFHFLFLKSQLWKSLGDLSREEAMKRYISLIAKVCPLFHAHFEAHKRHVEEQENLKLK
jgi:hypothetical protein